MAGFEDIISDIKTYSTFKFSRSGGPGGQNVNKVNTKVFLSVPIESLSSLDNSEKLQLRSKLGNRINSNDELYIMIQQERSQYRNKAAAMKILAELICRSLHRSKKRKRTLPSRASQERRLYDKKRRADIKKNRSINDGNI